MSERLSRMDRHPSTRKKRRKRQSFKQEWQDNQSKLSDTTVLRLSVPENRKVLPERTPDIPSVNASVVSHTAERPFLKATVVDAPSSGNETELDEELPPRSMMYPSGRIRLTKWFYETLILLFLILLGTLLWWGTQATGVELPWQ